MRRAGRSRRLSLVAPLAAALLAGAASSEEPAGASDARGLGYAIGYQVGSDFRRQALALDEESLVRGVRDALSGAEPALSAEEMRAVLAELGRQAAARRQREAGPGPAPAE